MEQDIKLDFWRLPSLYEVRSLAFQPRNKSESLIYCQVSAAPPVSTSTHICQRVEDEGKNSSKGARSRMQETHYDISSRILIGGK